MTTLASKTTIKPGPSNVGAIPHLTSKETLAATSNSAAVRAAHAQDSITPPGKASAQLIQKSADNSARNRAIEEGAAGVLVADEIQLEGNADAVRVLHPERMPLEGEPARALAHFTAQVLEDLAAWREFRASFAGAVPGKLTFQAASDLLSTIRRAVPGPPSTDKRLYSLPALPDLSPVRDYLTAQLTPEDLGLVREMTNFSGRHYIGQAETAQLFGFPHTPTLHRYAVEVRGTGTAKASLWIGGGIVQRQLRLYYSNDLGLSYDLPLKLSGGIVIVGFSGGLDSPELEVEGQNERTPEVTTRIFWAPSDFLGTYQVVKVGVQGGVKAGSAGQMPEMNLVELLTFHAAGRDAELTFDLGHFQAGPDISLGAGIEAAVEEEVGKASTTRPGGRPFSDPPLVTPLPKWLPAFETTFYFATGKADLGPEESEKIIALRRRLEPSRVGGLRLRFDVTGHASPRWRRPSQEADRAELNQELSERRAAEVARALRTTFDPLLVQQCEFHIVGCPPVQSDLGEASTAVTRGLGDVSARAQGALPDDDSWLHRRVDVVVAVEQR